MTRQIELKHWVNKKRMAVKLKGEKSSMSRYILLTVKEGREEYGKNARLTVGESLLLADWLRETALEMLRGQETVEAVEE